MSKAKSDVVHTCGECANAYDFQWRGYRDGEYTMCRCKHVDNGEHCILVTRKECKNFKLKKIEK